MVIITKPSGMSLHFEKHKGGDSSINGLCRHNEREPGQNHSNENIDPARTHENIILFQTNRDLTLKQRIDQTIESRRQGGSKGVRKDAVRLIEATVQLSGGVLSDPAGSEKVLREMYDWICDTFGKENIVSAAIHKDETNPHLHVDFVPITEDGKLSAKQILSKTALQKYQKDSLEHVKKHNPRFCFERVGNVLNGLDQKVFEEVMAEFDWREEELQKQAEELDEKLSQREAALSQREAGLERLQAEMRLERSNLTKYEQKLNSVGEVLKNKENVLNREIEALKSKQETLDKKERTLEAREKNVSNRENDLCKVFEAAKQKKLEAEQAVTTWISTISDLLDRLKQGHQEAIKQAEELLKNPPDVLPLEPEVDDVITLTEDMLRDLEPERPALSEDVLRDLEPKRPKITKGFHL